MKFLKNRSISFTEGPVVSKLILFAIPIILSELLQNLYNSADSLIVGNYVGEASLAAVSVCGPITNLLIGFFNGMSIGNTVMVAHAFGSGKEEETRKAVRYAFTFSIALGVVVAALGILLAPVLLDITGCNEEIYAEAIVYLRIYLAGLLFTVIYNCGTGILRAVGDSTSPLAVLAVTSILNIILDFLFVAVFGWGTAGVGIATILAQGVSVLLIHRLIGRRVGVRPVAFRETWQSGRRSVLVSMNVGLAAGLQNALISFSNIFVWSYINVFPTSVSAGIGVASKIDRFVILPCKSLAMTTTTYVSQNLGAGEYKRARKGFWYGLGLSASVTLVLAVLLYLFAEPAARLFSPEPDVIAASAGMSRLFAPLYIFMILREVIQGYLRGYGRSKVPMLLSLIGMVGIRQLFLAWATAKWPGELFIIYICYPIGWFMNALLLFIYMMIVLKKMWRQAEERNMAESRAV